MARPMYRQIAEDLREQIESGALAEGARLPPEVELRDRYQASRNTLRDAIKWLAGLGLVETRPGQGTFVVRKIEPLVTIIGPDLVADGSPYPYEATAQRRRASTTVPQVSILEADRLVAGRLQLPEGAEVISRHRQRLLDGGPWSLQTAYYPRQLADDGAQRLLMSGDMTEGESMYVEQSLGLRQGTWSATLAARPPAGYEMDFFGLADRSTWVVDLIQTCYDQSEKPICVAITTYQANRSQFEVTVGEFPFGESSGDSR